MRRNLVILILILTVLVGNQAQVNGQTDEGVGKMRTVQVSGQVLDAAMAMKYGDSIYDLMDSAEDNLLPLAEKAFGLSLEDIKAVAADFEDTDEFEIEEQTLYISGDKMRVDTESDGMKISIIMLMKEGMYRTVMWDMKSYMEMSFDQIKAMAQSAKSSMEAMGISSDESSASGQAKLMRKDKKTVNGFSCTEVIAYDSETVIQALLTQDLGLWKKFKEWGERLEELDSEGGGSAAEMLMSKQDGLSVIEKQYEISSLSIDEVLEFRKTAVSADMFKLPGDFVKRSIPGM